MSKTLHDVAPFEYHHYSVTDLYNRSVKYFSCLGAVRNFIWNKVKHPYTSSYSKTTNINEISLYDLVATSEKTHQHDWKSMDEPLVKVYRNGYRSVRTTHKIKLENNAFLVKNNLGAIITTEQIIAAPKFEPVYKPCKYDSDAYRAMVMHEQKGMKTRIRKKNNLNKIKDGVDTYEGIAYNTHEKTLKENWYRFHRRLKTTQEHRVTCGHDSEFRDEFKFGRSKRKGKNLPNSWDDFNISAWYSRKSWKTNSKRKHQWKVKE